YVPAWARDNHFSSTLHACPLPGHQKYRPPYDLLPSRTPPARHPGVMPALEIRMGAALSAEDPKCKQVRRSIYPGRGLQGLHYAILPPTRYWRAGRSGTRVRAAIGMTLVHQEQTVSNQ